MAWMSFRGKIVDKQEIETPFGKVTMTKKEYDQCPKRKKIIWWMGYVEGNTGICKLGELITTYWAGLRKNDFEPMKWRPLSYEIVVNEKADVKDIAEMYFIYHGQTSFEFDSDQKEDVDTFIEGIKFKNTNAGAVCVDSKAEYNRWVKVFEKIINK